MRKKLYRNKDQAAIGGVCAGLADYVDVDIVVVRLIFVLLSIFGGGGLLIYLVMWIVVPSKPVNTINYNVNGNSSTYTNNTEDDCSQRADVEDVEYTESSEQTCNGNSQHSNDNSDYEYSSVNEGKRDVVDNKRMSSRAIIGALLMLFGAMYILEDFIPIPIDEYFFPIVLIVTGALLFFNK